MINWLITAVAFMLGIFVVSALVALVPTLIGFSVANLLGASDLTNPTNFLHAWLFLTTIVVGAQFIVLYLESRDLP